MSNEARVRRVAKRNGYRVEKSDDRYTLIDDRLNAVMQHFKGVSLDEIAKFFATNE